MGGATDSHPLLPFVLCVIGYLLLAPACGQISINSNSAVVQEAGRQWSLHHPGLQEAPLRPVWRMTGSPLLWKLRTIRSVLLSEAVGVDWRVLHLSARREKPSDASGMRFICLFLFYWCEHPLHVPLNNPFAVFFLLPDRRCSPSRCYLMSFLNAAVTLFKVWLHKKNNALRKVQLLLLHPAEFSFCRRLNVGGLLQKVASVCFWLLMMRLPTNPPGEEVMFWVF